MQDKGQVTVFIIVGMLLLVAIAFAAYLSRVSAPVTEDIPVLLQTSSIESYVEQCIRSTATEAILSNGRSGGYFLLPEHSTTELFEDVPYYYELGQELFPTDEDYAREIALYVDTFLDFCLQDFAPFVQQGYEIEAGEPVSDAMLSPRRINVRTTLPLTIAQGMQVRELSLFSVDVDAAELYGSIAAAKEIIATQQEGEQAGEVCLTCFSNLAEENELFVAILPYYNNTYIFDITDNDYVIQEENYHLRFAVRYSAGE